MIAATAQEAAWAVRERAVSVLLDAGLEVDQVVRVLAPQVLEIPVCRVCGYTDSHCCGEGLNWVDDSLCSACAEEGGEG